MFSFRLCSSRDLCTKKKENYMIRESVTEWSEFAQHSEEKTESFFAPVFKYQFSKPNLMETLTLFFFLLLSNLYQIFLSLQLNILKVHWQMCLLEIICPELPVQTSCCLPQKKKISAHWSWHQLWSSSEPNTQWNTKTSEVAHTLEYLESQFSTDCLLFSSSCPGDPIAFHRKLRFHWCT